MGEVPNTARCNLWIPFIRAGIDVFLYSALTVKKCKNVHEITMRGTLTVWEFMQIGVFMKEHLNIWPAIITFIKSVP